MSLIDPVGPLCKDGEELLAHSSSENYKFGKMHFHRVSFAEGIVTYYLTHIDHYITSILTLKDTFFQHFWY